MDINGELFYGARNELGIEFVQGKEEEERREKESS
jgi:hypothetical protein